MAATPSISAFLSPPSNPLHSSRSALTSKSFPFFPLPFSNSLDRFTLLLFPFFITTNSLCSYIYTHFLKEERYLRGKHPATNPLIYLDNIL